MKRRIIKYLIFIFFLNFVQFSKLYSQLKIISPIKYNYTAFNGDKYSALLYEGQYTNLIFTDTLVHDDTTCTKLSIMLDSVWSYYYQMSKTLPNTSSSYNKKGNVAFVSNTCGAGCAFIGTGSLEVGDANWVNIFNNVKYVNNGSVLKVAFYELGRNFYNSKIDENLSVYPFWIPEPFANMGYLNAIDYLGLYMKDQYENELGYKFDLIDRANEFILDTNVKLISDVYTKDLYPNAYGNSGFRPFFNSGLLMKLCYEYGETFIKNFYKELYLLPKTNGDISEAYSNFCIASSKAVNINLKNFFIDGYKMNLNLKRVDESLANLPLLKLKVFANDNRAENYFKDSLTIFRIKAFGSKGQKDIKYKLYEGEINNESKFIATSLNGIFYLPNKKFDYKFWIKINDGTDSIISNQLNYLYRCNLLKDSSFEIKPNSYPNNVASSIEFYGNPYNSLLSASIDSNYKTNGKFSLRFNHSFFKNCGTLTNSDFPTIDYTASYVERFKGKYKVSANILIKEKFETCPGVVYGAGIGFGLRNGSFISYPAGTNNLSATFQTISGIIDTKDDPTSSPKTSIFTIISSGIKGDGYVDAISLKAVLPPEQIKIISINTDTSNSSKSCFNQKDSIKILLDSAQDIKEYNLLISKDSTFKFGVKNILNTFNYMFFTPTDTGRYFLISYGTNEFGDGTASSIKSIFINNIPSPPIISRDTNSFLISNSAKGNTWYKDGSAITDTTQKYKPATPGSYSAKTTTNGCTSVMSSAYYYLVTDIINLSNDEFIKLAPNPFINQLNFDFIVKGYQRLNLEVFDIATGTKVASQPNLTAGTKITLGQLSAGTYVIRVTSNDNKISYQFKMVKL